MYKRIISLVPSQTELLYDLGLEEEVVGITKFCIHPTKWYREKERVGGTKNVNIEKVKQLAPDLIIANKEENTKESVDLLSKNWPVYVSDIKDIKGALAMIREIGELTSRRLEADKLIEAIQLKVNTLRHLGSAIYLIWNKPIMIAGKDTFISDMMRMAGFDNLAKEDRYPEYTLEQLQTLSPQYLLLSSEPYPFKDVHKNYFESVLPKTKVILVDGEMFSWYGSRLLKSFDYFRALHASI